MPTTLRGTLRVPGDKSASHRALMMSALAAGESTIEGLSPGLDVAATSQIMEQLGARRRDDDGRRDVVGPADGLRASVARRSTAATPARPCVSSAGIVSAVEGAHQLDRRRLALARPMDRVAVPLALMGASVEARVHASSRRCASVVHARFEASTTTCPRRARR